MVHLVTLWVNTGNFAVAEPSILILFPTETIKMFSSCGRNRLSPEDKLGHDTLLKNTKNDIILSMFSNPGPQELASLRWGVVVIVLYKQQNLKPATFCFEGRRQTIVVGNCAIFLEVGRCGMRRVYVGPCTV